MASHFKKIGLIGGLGPEATVDYYKALIDSFKQENEGRLDYPEMVIYSVNMEHFIGLVRKGDYTNATAYLADKLQALERSGVDFLALTANTPHLFFDELQAAVKLPMISIVEAAARYAVAKGIKRAGLMGTSFTMSAGFFQEVFARYGVEVVIPSEEDRNYINEKLFSEIELGVFKPATRGGLVDVIARMKAAQGIDGMIMGCTELPLILPDSSYHGVHSLNTTQIHVAELVAACKGGSF